MDSIIAQSRGHSELFDIIDELRLQGISQYVALPEIVVCGDQSSGKSSVLEAISGMSFPTKDTLCTRFPTELVLRRAPASDSSCKVSINPDPERPESEQDTLRGFRRDVDISSLDLSQVVEDATKAMGISDEQRRFSKDVLRIELSGPTQPHLTLIDLPGIWASDTKEQSEDDLEAVKKMVSEYAARERCIILAVVSAQIEATNQSTTKFIRDVDPGRQRTMGLITKPDDPSPGSGREASFINLAQNNSIVFRHGWHVLRNRSFEERNHTRAQRDKTERNFFSRSQWNIEPLQGKLGVASLKPRLSNLLREQIITHLPGFIAEVSAEIKDVEAKLERLGQPRKTIGAKRQYLIDVSKEFTSLATAAVDGNYNGDFFHDPRTPEGAKQHLRATVQATLEDLSTDIQQRGRARRIVDTEEHFEEGSGRISRDDYVDEVKDLMRRTRGRELPGTFNPAIIEILFKQQCKPWTGLVDECLDKIVTATQALVESVLDTVTAPETRSGILQRASEGIAGAKEELGKKAREILSQFTVTHPITYNHYLTDTVQKVQQERRNRGLDQILGSYNLDRYGYLSVTPEALKSALSGHMETSMGNFSSLLAIDYAEAYYKVASKKLVDDISILAVEKCLMTCVPGLFTRDMVDNMTEKEMSFLARETHDADLERTWCEKKRDVLHRALRKLRTVSSPDYMYEYENEQADSGLRSDSTINDMETPDEAYPEEDIPEPPGYPDDEEPVPVPAEEPAPVTPEPEAERPASAEPAEPEPTMEEMGTTVRERKLLRKLRTNPNSETLLKKLERERQKRGRAHEVEVVPDEPAAEPEPEEVPDEPAAEPAPEEAPAPTEEAHWEAVPEPPAEEYLARY